MGSAVTSYTGNWGIKSLHQVEITSNCNLRCVYCPSPNLGRPKLDMSRAHFLRAMEGVKHLVSVGTQGELNIAGIGESTLHPDFVEYVRIARGSIGWQRKLHFATNGLLMTRDLAKAIAPFRPSVAVSMHRPEKAKGAIDALREFGLFEGAASDAATNAVDWAGQVDWKLTTDNFGSPCDWRSQGWIAVLADGRMSSCAMDADGSGVIGHVDQEFDTVRGRPYKLCKGCHFDVGVDGFRNRVEGRLA